MPSHARAMANTVQYIWKHPLGGSKGLMRFVRWHTGARIMNPRFATFNWVDDTQLELELGRQGATGNYYCGLHEYQEMSLLLDLLRPGQLFVDVGANVGSFTVLASGVCGARTLALEPGPDAHSVLMRHISLNGLEHLVDARMVGAAGQPGNIRFTMDQDTVNHVVVDSDNQSNTTTIEVDTLDNLLAGQSATLIKIDVEGWEPAVLQGAQQTLASPDLEACIIESNPMSNCYGFARDSVENTMANHGFQPFTYRPQRREFSAGADPYSNNMIFLRDAARLSKIVAEAPIHRILGH